MVLICHVRGRDTSKTLKMVLTVTLCNAPHLKSLSKGINASAYCICCRVVPDYAADSSALILLNVIEKEIGPSTILVDQLSIYYYFSQGSI